MPNKLERKNLKRRTSKCESAGRQGNWENAQCQLSIDGPIDFMYSQFFGTIFYARVMKQTSLTTEEFEQLLPLAATWAEEQESQILAHGQPLTTQQLSDARTMGVSQPERVRLLIIPQIPMPDHPLLIAAGHATGLLSPYTAGLTLRHGIYIRQDVADDRFLVAHELVHTRQYERLGGILPFLRQYLHECLTIGYPAAPLEQEAVVAAERLSAQFSVLSSQKNAPA